jgi:hypothetical protein
MSTESSTNHCSTPTITLTRNEDGRWTARDLEAEISAQGETRKEALDNLDRVVAALRGEEGHPPTDEELRDAGIDSDENAQRGSGELPDELQ